VKSLVFVRWALCAALLAGSAARNVAQSAEYDGYSVGVVRPGGDRACVLFQLVGVPVADPIANPTSPWFSIPDTAPDFSSMVAALLAAKMAGTPIDVVTTGSSPPVCGHPGVAVLLLP